jgi:hypothetical protein
MLSQSFNTEVNPGDASAKGKHKPVSDEELKGKDSFPSVNDNQLLNRLLSQRSGVNSEH